jgi:hypothetical protein
MWVANYSKGIEMETYVDVYVSADGEKTSVIYDILLRLGFKPALGSHDFVYDWEKIVTIAEVVELADKAQEELKGTGVYLQFTTDR